MRLGFSEFILLFLIALILLGPTVLPRIARWYRRAGKQQARAARRRAAAQEQARRAREELHRDPLRAQKRTKEGKKFSVKPSSVVGTGALQIAVRRGEDRIRAAAVSMRCHLTGNGSVTGSVVHHWDDMAVQINHKNLP